MKPQIEATPDEAEANRMPLMEHLRELRYRLIVSFSSLGVGMGAGMVFSGEIYDFLRAPIQAVFHEEPQNRMDHVYAWLTQPVNAILPVSHMEGSLNIGNSPLEGMYSWFQVGLIGGAALASPIIAYQLWQFIAPGLYSNEKKYVVPLAMSSSFLFLCGAMFCYAVIFPVSFPFFLTALQDTTAVISVQGYLEAIVRMMIGFGLCFQLPIGVFFLARVGLIDHRDMVSFFRYAIVAIFVVAAIITPTADIFSQTLLAVPLLGLYGIGIVVAFFTTTKQRVA